MRLIKDTCDTCGRAIGDPKAEEPEHGSAYCYDCGRYIEPTPDSSLQAEYDHLARTAPDVKAGWHRSQFHLVTEGTAP